MREDEPMRVASYLERRMTADEALYVANYQPILYYLVSSARRPTRYLFPSVLTSTHFARVAGIDALQELQRIMRAVRPTFVVAGTAPTDHEYERALSRYLVADYVLDAVMGEARIYRRRSES